MRTHPLHTMRAVDIIARGGVSGGDGPTILDMVRAQISARLDDREQLRRQAAEIEGTVAARNGDPTDDEVTQIRDLRARVAEIDADLEGRDGEPGLRARERELEAQAEADRRAADERRRLDALTGRSTDTGNPDERRGLDDNHHDQPITGNERGSIFQQERRSFITEAFAAHQGSAASRERIDRSNRYEADLARRSGAPLTRLGEEVRDVTTSAFGSFVIPQYLLSQAAEAVAAGAPLYEALPKIQLPAQGMTITIPRVTTATAAGVQAAEGDAPTETDIAVTDYAVPVVTITGKQDISRQSIDRGEMVDELVVRDLVRRYFTTLDSQLLNGSGSSGQHLGVTNVSSIQAVTYTDASPTAAEAWPKLADAAQKVASNQYMPLDLWVLHPRRYAWFYADTDSTGRPLIVPAPYAQNPTGVGGVPGIGRMGYTLAGAAVLQDANVATNQGAGTEDSIVGLVSSELPVFVENGGVPRTLRFDLTAEEITVAVWAYSAFASGRYPNAIVEITGTGLAAPTF